MKILINRSGGFTGMNEIIAEINTLQMNRAQAQKAEQLVEDIKFFDLPVTVSGGGIGADFQRYQVSVTKGEQQHTICFDDDESDLTAPLRKLVETLLHLIR